VTLGLRELTTRVGHGCLWEYYSVTSRYRYIVGEWMELWLITGRFLTCPKLKLGLVDMEWFGGFSTRPAVR